MAFDIYEEKILTFSNIVMKQNRFVSYIFMATYIFSFLVRVLRSLFNGIMSTQPDTSQVGNTENIVAKLSSVFEDKQDGNGYDYIEPTRNPNMPYATNQYFGEEDHSFPFPKQSNTLPNHRYRHRRLGENELQKYYNRDGHSRIKDVSQMQHLYTHRVNIPLFANRRLSFPASWKYY